jgi:hypothetical protein
MSEEIEQLTEKTENNTQSLRDNAEQAERNAAAYKALDDALLDVKVSTGELTEAEAELERQILRKGEALDKARAAFIEAQKGIGNLEEATENLRKAYQDLAGDRGLARAQTAVEEFSDSVSDSLKNVAQATLGIKFQQGAMGNLFESFQKAGQEGAKFTSVTQLFTKVAGKANLALMAVNATSAVGTAIRDKFVEATLSAAKTSQDLGDSLGRELGLLKSVGEVDSLLKLAQESNNANVTLASLGQAVAELQVATQGMFGNIAKERPELALFSNEMVGLGVSTQTTAELFGKFGKILGTDSVNDIKKLEKEAIKMARTFGLSSDAVIKDIAGMAESLAEFGDRTDDIALDVAKIAGSAKISSQSVLGFGKSFEFFPDAINAANELNLIFQRNVVDGQKLFMMMNDGTQGPGAAFRTFITDIGPALNDAFLGSTTNMRSFNRTLAQFGVTETDARKLAEDIVAANKQGRSLTQVLDERSKSIEKNEKALQGFSTLTKELTKLQDNFAVALGPVADILTKIVQGINSLNPRTLRIIGGLAATVATAMGAAGTGAAIGTVLGGPAGTLLGGAIGGIGSLITGGIATAAIADGVITSSGGKTTVTKVDSQDDLKIVAAKPGGPISRMGSTSGVGTAEIVVSLFGEELVRRMVDLVDAEQGKRKAINSIVQGAA